MNVRFLETFVCVAQLRSFSATATHLNTTQAAVSNRIATLERDLDTRLFERGKREISLTPSGMKLLDHASSIVSLAAEIKSVLSSELSSHSIVIGATETIVRLWLPTFLRRLRMTHANVAVELVVDGMPSLTRHLEKGEIDLAFTIDPVVGATPVGADFCRLDCRWFAETRCDLPHGRMQFKDLTRHGFVTFPRASAQSVSLQHLMAKHRVDRDSTRIVHCDSAGAIITLVSEGLGVACLPEILVGDYVADGTLRYLDVGEVLGPFHFQSLTPASLRHPLARDAITLAASVAEEYCLGARRSCADLSAQSQGRPTGVALVR